MTFADRGPVARRALPYAVTLAALCVAAGCTSGSPTPSASTVLPTTTASSSATTSASATPTAKPSPSVDPVVSKIPAAARPETMAGAEAFAQFYVGQVNMAYTRADPDALLGLSSSACKACEAFLETAVRFRDDGVHHDAPSLSVTSATATTFTPSRREVTAFVTQSAVSVIDSNGASTSRTSAAKGAFLFTLSFDSHWRVARLQTAKS